MLENACTICEGGSDELIYSIGLVATTISMLLPPTTFWQLASLIAAIMTNILAL